MLQLVRLLQAGHEVGLHHLPQEENTRQLELQTRTVDPAHFRQDQKLELGAMLRILRFDHYGSYFTCSVAESV